MSSQGMTRKRPAPGTVPPVHPQMNPVPNFPTTASPGSQLSNDQFLQWGQNPPANAINTSAFSDPSYNPASFVPPPDVSAPAATASNQLARRQANQMVSRNRGYEQPPASYVENSGNNGNGESGAWGESLEELYRRALTAKRDSQAKRKQIPPFVQKLSSFLDESKNTELIRWSDDGNSFVVLDEDEFARTLIPELFKHNNYASFVRQLNMYGFHKKVGLSDNSMRASERKNKSPSEYANPYFKRGHPDLLWLIQKPKNAGGGGHASKPSKGGTRVKTEDIDDNDMDDYAEEGAPAPRDNRAPRPQQLSLVTDSSVPSDQLSGVYRELQAIRQQQSIISTTITRLRKEHEQLYAQAANFQEQHTRHENSINAILTFLATVYNRSLQGEGGPQNLANSFAGAISQDQGNIVDVDDDYLNNALGSMTSPNSQRTMKKQPLLLKAPPTADAYTRTSTVSPSTGGSYDTRSRGHARQPSAGQHGHVEEVFDHSPRPSVPTVAPGQPTDETVPQRDIMSVIQNSNARNGLSTNFSEFPNVLSSLENHGGNVPLTANQRADMLRLMANETNSSEPNVGVSPNNALISPTPPPMPHNYSGRLASTRQEIDNLVKMQAEQDRSVQNLTSLLQPLSPNGTIPGIEGSDGNVPPPPLDLDQIFNNDYFTDIGDAGSDLKKQAENPMSHLGTGHNTHDPVGTTQGDDGDTNDLFDFDHIPAEPDLFETPHHGPSDPTYHYGFDGVGYDESGRVIEQLTDSEATSPATTEHPGEPMDDGGSATKRRRKA
ncbi:Heat shock factor (HSF)-type DNA-binding [Penicillium cf. griseofulvum]|uniref:Heat shock factor (HSF)-type DNA-binding n=1 Tax=Penicillium cf. griseofulvum TaxID=2972120 RepID=A0A9W9IMM6_9EURO|nr:Heat shock factor (HSF)-type DNA-binding [Penicillium cf. griseofulvum]KAJ5443069.1 Heat shock factor (HSF)-type DNA-binding [Penicillium cf. griseofulvum]